MNGTAVVSLAQIGAQVQAVLERDPATMAIGIRAQGKGDWPPSIDRQGRTFDLCWCESRLALREALVSIEAPTNGSRGIVLLTPLKDSEIPDDVASRLARGRVFQPRGWDIVKQMFGARDVDARLGRYDWIPDVLIDTVALGPFLPVAGGFVDLETVWREVMTRCLGLDAAQPDAATLMRWTLRPDVSALMGKLPAKAQEDVLDWMGSHAGAAGRLVVWCIRAGRPGDAAALGVVCDVVFAPEAEGQAEVAQAAVRLERYVGDQHVSVSGGREWAAQARRLLDHVGPEESRAILDRADALLKELRIAEFAHLSDWLPSGLEQQMLVFAQRLAMHAGEPSEQRMQGLEVQADAVLTHRLAILQPLRADRVRMARRLARWLVRSPAAAAGLDGCISVQAEEGAFVDWARFKLLGGDELPELSTAYAALRGAVAGRRDAMNKSFAASLAVSLKQAAPLGARALSVEQVLDGLVAPLAAAHPVLLLVIDGLSLSIFRELFERVERQGWVELASQAVGAPMVALAAFPTITEISRSSLLCGRLAAGAASTEKTAFAAHQALLAASPKDRPPKLFHKGDLSVDGNLASDVRAALADVGQRVVGVVYNAVDDHLSGPDQLHQRWSLEDLRLLLPLLREARDSRRVVVVTADHGHILDDGTAQFASAPSDRWRVGHEVTDAREVALIGSRVLTPEGSNRVVCLWSETARYAGRKNGYHGGASPAEAIVPLSVYAPFGVNVSGWDPAPPQLPDWWDLPAAAAVSNADPVASVKAPAKRPSAAPTPPPAQGGLFGEQELPTPAQPAVTNDWLAAMFASAAYASQRQLAARVALPEDQLRVLLGALEERGGKLTRAALAQRLGVPELRMGGVLSAARRMLNVDQVPVLHVDEASGTVELNKGLLLQQFRLAGNGGAR